MRSKRGRRRREAWKRVLVERARRIVGGREVAVGGGGLGLEAGSRGLWGGLSGLRKVDLGRGVEGGRTRGRGARGRMLVG